MGGTTSKVLKVVGLFTGVESLGIICSIVKNKLVSIWLSTVGMGLFGIFNSTIEVTTYLTSFSIRQSSVRDIAAGSKTEGAIRRIIRCVRSWSVASGLLGASLLLALSWPLAQLILGDGIYWWNFAILGAAMLFNAVAGGENAIFQGTERYRALARTGVQTAVAGLLVSIPMYRWLGDASVALSILAYALLSTMFALLNRDRKYDGELPSRAGLKGGTTFIKLGAYLSISAFVSSLCQLVLVSWLNVNFTTVEAGLYAAGMTLVMRYTSLLFNSIGLEFYPRISASIDSPRRVEIFVGHEIMLLLSILLPCVLSFEILAPVIVPLLFSSKFMAIVPFVSWGMLATLLRCASTVMAYVIVARGDGKAYLAVEGTDALAGLGLCIAFYLWLGLTGIGIALVVWHLWYLAVVWCVYSLRYGYRLHRRSVMRLAVSLLAGAGALVAVTFMPRLWSSVVVCAATLGFITVLIWRRRSR